MTTTTMMMMINAHRTRRPLDVVNNCNITYLWSHKTV